MCPTADVAALSNTLSELFGTPASPAVPADAAGGGFYLSAANLAAGSRLYGQKCANCHGYGGDGRGPVGPLTTPYPRDFRAGVFKVAVGGHKPTADQLAGLLRRGVPGSAMPIYDLLPEPDVRALVAYLVHLSTRGEAEVAGLKAAAEGDDPAAAARAKATTALAEWAAPWSTAPAVSPPGYGAPDHADAVRRGSDLFQSPAAGCTSCHRDYGRAEAFRYDVWGSPVKVADLTRGEFRWGRDDATLAARVRHGIPAVGMPANPHLTDAQVSDLVTFGPRPRVARPAAAGRAGRGLPPDGDPMTAVRLTRVLAWSAVAAAGVLLTLGWLTTSFRAGMADPVWPTEPWYLVVNGQVWKEPNRAFLLEHTHRAAGFVVGGLTGLLALAVWWTDRNQNLRGFGLGAALLLLVMYGQFHREMGVAWKARLAGEAAVVWPANSGLMTAIAAGLLLTAAGLTAGPDRWTRRLASVSLVAVMVQGLLGGYRVYLDQLAGMELAVVHGTFGQVVFCLLLATAVLALPATAELTAGERRQFGGLSLALVGLVFVQLVWGVLVRHGGSAAAQQLHLLTAFAVTGLAVWLAVRLLNTPRLRGKGVHLLGIVGVQVTLGVQAWMGKFAATGPQAAVPPMLRDVTVGWALTRTLHAAVGAALLASAVLLALRVWRRVPSPEPARSVAEPAAAVLVA